MNRNSYLARALLTAFSWMRRKSEYANGNTGDRCRVADAAVDDDSRPAIPMRERRELVSNKGTIERSSSVDDEDSAPTRFGERLPDEDVVVADFDRNDFAAKPARAAKIAKKRRDDAYPLSVLIAEIRCAVHR